MGEAKRRGKFDQRVQQAQGAAHWDAKAEYWLNEAKRISAWASRAEVDAMIVKSQDCRQQAALARRA